MAKGRYISYLRVSTDRQGRSGLGIEAQRKAVGDYLNGGRWTLVSEFIEVETGTRKGERPKLQEALAACRIYGAQLVIAKLDRLARNVAFISNLMESGVDFTAVDFPQANRLTVHILAAVAEHEAEAISRRTKEALAAAKARGVRIGGDRGNLHRVRDLGRTRAIIARKTTARQRATDLKPVIDEVRASGVESLGGIARALEERRIRTAQGKDRWSPQQVSRVLQQMENAPITTVVATGALS